MARPVLASKGTVSVVTTNAPAPSYPAVVAANDILIAEVVKYDGTTSPTIATPTSWTLLTSVNLIDGTGAKVGLVSWFWFRPTGSLAGALAITTTGGTGNSTIACAQIYRITGCITTGNPFDNSSVSSGGTSASAVTWNAIREYHSAEELAMFFCAGAGAGLTQPPAAPTGLQAISGVPADSSTSGADGFTLVYGVITPAEPSLGPYASATSRIQWGALAINFISAAYVGQSLKSSTDSGSGTEGTTKVGVSSKEQQPSSFTQDFLDAFTSGLDANWVSPYTSGDIALPVSGGQINAPAAASDGIWNHDLTTLGSNVVRFSLDVVSFTVSNTDIGDLGFTNTTTLDNLQWTIAGPGSIDGIINWYQGGTLQAQAASISGGSLAAGDTVIVEWDRTGTGTFNVYKVHSGVETLIATATSMLSSSINTILGSSNVFPYLDAFNSGGSLDNAKISHLVTASNAVESGSVTTGGGSTAKSDSDTNGTTTETATGTAQLSSSDANGATTETTSTQLSGTDANGATTESANVVVPVSSSDANGATTEAASIGLSSADVNGATTEATSLVAALAGSDANGATAETVALRLSGSDVNGATTEAANITVPVSSSDINGATTEAASATAQLAGTDANGATTESAAIKLSSADANGATTEAANVSVPISGSDTNGATTEASALVAALTGSDANATTTELAALRLSGSDANGVTTESASILAALSGSDANGVTTEAASVAVPISSSDANGATAEGAAIVALVSAADANGVTTELFAISLAGNDTNSVTTESATPSALVTSADSNGVTTENATTGSVNFVSSSDSNGATTESAGATAQVSSSDTSNPGVDTGSVTKKTLFDSDFGAGLDTQAPPRVQVSYVDLGSGTELVAALTARLTSGDSGTSTESASVRLGTTYPVITTGAILPGPHAGSISRARAGSASHSRAGHIVTSRKGSVQ